MWNIYSNITGSNPVLSYFIMIKILFFLDMSYCYFKISLFSSIFNFNYLLYLWEINLYNSFFTYCKVESIWFMFSVLLYIIGLSGFIFNTSSLLIILIKAEIMFLGIGLNFLGFSSCLHDPKGQIYTLFLLSVVASESIIGLSLIYISYRLIKQDNEIADYSLLSD